MSGGHRAVSFRTFQRAAALKMPWSAGILPALGAAIRRRLRAGCPRSRTFHGFWAPVSGRAWAIALKIDGLGSADPRPAAQSLRAAGRGWGPRLVYGPTEKPRTPKPGSALLDEGRDGGRLGTRVLLWRYCESLMMDRRVRCRP
jgi:hypothetical protein